MPGPTWPIESRQRHAPQTRGWGNIRPMPRLRHVLLLAVAALALPAMPALAQRSADEQRCTGQQSVTASAQIAACTALIDSGRFSRQNLSILHSNRGIAYGKAGDLDRAVGDFDAAIRITPNHVR